jgi:hypothetical protein
MQDMSSTARTTLTALAVIIGLFLVVIAPIIVQASLDPVIEGLLVEVVERPQFLSGISLFTLFYPFWRAVCFIAGVALLVIASSIYKREDWTIPVALTAYAMPAIGGMFMFLPYISWVEDAAFPVLPMVISWVGLAGFWATLILRKSAKIQKVIDLSVFTFSGMLATHSFVIGIGAARQLMTRPSSPLYEGLEWWILTMTGDIDWICTIMLIIAIPMLSVANKDVKKAGWWLTLIAAFSILAIDAPAQLIRTNTWDYLYGSLLALGLIASLLVPLTPIFKERFPVEEESQSQPVDSAE